MKTFILFLLFFIFPKSLKADFPVRCTHFYNELLEDQAAIHKINQLRSKIYIYTDFGGGKGFLDLQTSGEIASAAWKETLHEVLYINDSAFPLSPLQAAPHLEATFPYDEKKRLDRIETIVVHVIDPGVGNEAEELRVLVLRKDGTLFIGPDNGTLSFVCPKGSIAQIWKIEKEKLNQLSGIDVDAGGTFHGRDLFSEAAFRIASGEVTPEEIGNPYKIAELKKRFPQSDLKANSLTFISLRTDRFILEEKSEIFDQAFLLGIIQSCLFSENNPLALTKAKKLFLVPSDDPIAIVNHLTGNIFIGPNNGVATSFFKHYSKEVWEAFEISPEIFEAIQKEENNEKAYFLLKKEPIFQGTLVEIPFLGDESALTRDEKGRPQKLEARIWIDLYGNIKTTAQSSILNEAIHQKANIKVLLNAVEKKVRVANSFSEVSEEELFIYNGSSAVIGPNPHRSKRYVELTSNGIYGKFGADFFENPKAGSSITFYFEYDMI